VIPATGGEQLPIFNDEKTKIVGSTVVQTLRLEYISSDGDQSSTSIALDLEDLQTLKSACEEGIKKAKLSKLTVEKEWQLESVLLGEKVT
jgi:hypothetical protein